MTGRSTRSSTTPGRSSPPCADVAGTVVDLGSGGGVPGLVDRRRPAPTSGSCWSTAGRPAPITCAASSGASGSPTGSTVRRRPTPPTLALAVAADAVVARGFGPPASTLRGRRRCCAPGGTLVVSEPPAPRPLDAGRPALLDARRASRCVERRPPRRRVPSPMFHVEPDARTCEPRCARRRPTRCSTWNIGGA